MSRSQTVRKPARPRSSSAGERRSSKPSRSTSKSATQEPATPGSTYERSVSFRQLVPSSLNYRTSFDRGRLDELKSEILLHGLIHNLLTRPLSEDRFEVLVGGRRTRALSELVDEGKWDPDAETIPVQVRTDLDDASALVIAIAENEKREDVHFLETADGIHHAVKLLTNGKGPNRTNRAIPRLAEKMAVTPRWVQILYGLATRLHPEVKDFIRSRNLSLDVAKAFAIVPADRQLERLPEISSRSKIDKSLVREILLRGLPAAETALFDPKDYKGEITQVEAFLDDPDQPPPFEEGTFDERFLNAGEFARLQWQALEEKRLGLEQTYAFAELIEGRRLPPGFEEQYGVRDDETGIILLVDPKDWFIHEIEVKRAPSHPETPSEIPAAALDPEGKDDSEDGPLPQLALAKPEPDCPPTHPVLRRDHVYKAHRLKTETLQRRVAASPVHAMRLVVASLITSHTPSRIAPADLRIADDWILSPALEETYRSLLQTFSGLFSPSADPEPGSFSPVDVYVPSWDEETPAKVLAILAGLSDDEIERLFAFLIAIRTGSFCDLNPKFGDSPAVLQLASMLGLECAETLLDDDYLSGYSKSHLSAVAQACGLPATISKKTMAEIRAALLAAPGLASYAPPELRFASTPEIQEALRKLATEPTPTPSED